ncbi:hypothetical protein [Butyrivibrio sp.]|uniref:hypothetical protein n=1 Tax=Butyrivibrio sp. TaxID=28121 RepID=UPI0025C00269|nr:hypothetical protein [Butyrivibrio sp.]MBE5839122.1 hypothetical protein [Butyrivibrio sp.]
MEHRTGTPIEKWDEVNGNTAPPVIKLPQELDPIMIGNVRRGLEDQIEQNDNNLDGIINNVPTVVDDNANGIPDEDEKEYHRQSAPEIASIPKTPAHEKEEKNSLLKMLHDCKPEVDDKPYRELHPELVL